MAGNRRVVLKAGPVGKVRASDFSIEEAPVPSPGDGQMLGERLSGGALAFERGNARRLRGGHLGGKVILAVGGFELFKLQLELVEQTAAALEWGPNR